MFDTARASTDSRDGIGLSIYRGGEPLVELDLGRVYDGSKCFALNAYMRQTLSGEAFRVSALPSAALDPSSQTIAVAWVDGERGCKASLFAGATNAQVKLVLVNGTDATKPRIVTRGADKALPAVAYRDGRVLVGFQTRTFAPADCVHNRKRVCLDYAYSTSADDFATEHRLSDGSSNPYEQFDGAFIGDYSALAVGADGVAHAVWTDSRSGDQNLFGAGFRP